MTDKRNLIGRINFVLTNTFNTQLKSNITVSVYKVINNYDQQVYDIVYSTIFEPYNRINKSHPFYRSQYEKYLTGNSLYVNDLSTCLVNYLLKNNIELSKYSGYTTPDDYRSRIMICIVALYSINMTDVYSKTSDRITNNECNGGTNAVTFNFKMNNQLKSYIDVDVVKERYDAYKTVYKITYESTYKPLNRINKSHPFYNTKYLHHLGGDILHCNELTTILVKYILMDDNTLTKYSGHIIPNNYRKRLMICIANLWD